MFSALSVKQTIVSCRFISNITSQGSIAMMLTAAHLNIGTYSFCKYYVRHICELGLCKKGVCLTFGSTWWTFWYSWAPKKGFNGWTGPNNGKILHFSLHFDLVMKSLVPPLILWTWYLPIIHKMYLNYVLVWQKSWVDLRYSTCKCSVFFFWLDNWIGRPILFPFFFAR